MHLFPVFLLTFNFLLLSTFPLKSLAFSENLDRSYMLEISRNNGLDGESLRYMAAGILMQNYSLTREAALEKSQKLSLHEAKIISLQSFYVKTFEIPLALIVKDSEFRTESLLDIKNHKQIFEKNGTKYIRWFIHPLHESEYIQSNYKEYEVKGKYKGRLTSSRSLLIHDSTTNEQWSLKSSLKKAAGPFSSKEYKSNHSAFHFQMSEILAHDPFLKEKFFLEESFIGLKNDFFDEGQLVRSLKPFEKGETIMALASLYDQGTAIRYSKKNGYGNNWKEFIQEKIMKDLGHTMAYLYENYGLIHNSLHSQNISIRFDKAGKYMGIFVRDPDFDVNIEKFEQRMGKRAAENFLGKKNIRTKDTIILDFSVLNGIRIPTLSLEETMSFYRKMGIQFFHSFLKTINQMRNGSLSEQEIHLRASNETFVEHQGQMGKRIAISFSGPDIERLLDPKAEFEISQRHSADKKTITSVYESKMKILEEIIDGKKELINYEPSSISTGWAQLVHELIYEKNTSKLQVILQENNPVIIKNLISMINKHKYLEINNFLEHVFLYYPEVIRTNDFFLIFNARSDARLMSLFLSIATTTQVKKLWTWSDSNQILEYPENLLKKFIVRLPQESLQAIIDTLTRNEIESSVFKKKYLSKNFNKVMNAINFKRGVSLPYKNSCLRYY